MSIGGTYGAEMALPFTEGRERIGDDILKSLARKLIPEPSTQNYSQCHIGMLDVGTGMAMWFA